MEIGKKQRLTVIRITSPGAFLATEEEPDKVVLLPNKEMTRELKPGDKVDVFIYMDSEDRPVATLKTPMIERDGFAPLKVVSTTKIGAFLDWGLDKNLLLPYSEQTTKVMQNRSYFVNMYLDKSGRLAATMKVYPKLRHDSELKKGDWTEGYVYQINPEVGAFVAVENKYSGMIRKEDINESVHNGRTIKVRVTGVRDDGKLMLSPIRKAYKEIDADAKKILDELKKHGGTLPYNDKSGASAIKAAFGISKSSFKRAVGRLLKENKIVQTAGGIKLK